MNFSALLCFAIFIVNTTSVKSIKSVWNDDDDDIILRTNQLRYNSDYDKAGTVDIKVYYECLCPDCRNFDSQQLVPAMKKLAGYLNLHMVPYGKARTDESNGKIKFECQHGAAECYGNKLHACVIDALQNITEAILFNSCMMDYSQAGRGSDDRAADACGYAMGKNTEPIKQCAKSDRGTLLLKQHGEETKQVNLNFVPHILVNNKLSDGTDFMNDVCKAFRNPPAACKKIQQNFLLMLLRALS